MWNLHSEPLSQSNFSPYKAHNFIDNRSQVQYFTHLLQTVTRLSSVRVMSLTQCLDRKALSVVNMVAVAQVIKVAAYGQPMAPPSQKSARYDSGEDLMDLNETFLQGGTGGFGGHRRRCGDDPELLST